MKTRPNNSALLLILGIWLGVLLGGLPQTSHAWEAIKNPTLTVNSSLDGDSIPIQHDGKDMIINLMFIDAPEQHSRYKDKNEAQAKVYGCEMEDIEVGGKAARSFIEELLGKSEFTVETKYSEIKSFGAGGIKRYYGMIKVGDSYLCELLINNGLAATGGRRADLMDGSSGDTFANDLSSKMVAAREAGMGLWGKNPAAMKINAPAAGGAAGENIMPGVDLGPGQNGTASSPPALPQGPLVLKKTATVYSETGEELRAIGKLRPGREIEVVGQIQLLKIRVSQPGKPAVEGYIRAEDVE